MYDLNNTDNNNNDDDDEYSTITDYRQKQLNN